MKKLRIVLLVGGPSAEHEVSLASGRVIDRALDKSKYDVRVITVPKTGRWFPSEEIAEADVVFIAMHGPYGEDGTIQGLLEYLRVPYTGSGVLASALAMDKLKAAEVYALYGLDTPKNLLISHGDWKNNTQWVDRIKKEIGISCVVKPRNNGSSVGISIVRKNAEIQKAVEDALRYSSHALAQQYIKGDEVTCAILDEGGETELLALPPTQIIPKTSTFFDYQAKYTEGASEEITPPRLPTETIKKIQEIALTAHRALGCSGMSRTDMIVSRDRVYVLETNTIPGMTETSLYPQAAAAAGIAFPRLLDKIVQSALRARIVVGS